MHKSELKLFFDALPHMNDERFGRRKSEAIQVTYSKMLPVVTKLRELVPKNHQQDIERGFDLKKLRDQLTVSQLVLEWDFEDL